MFNAARSLSHIPAEERTGKKVALTGAAIAIGLPLVFALSQEVKAAMGWGESEGQPSQPTVQTAEGNQDID